MQGEKYIVIPCIRREVRSPKNGSLLSLFVPEIPGEEGRLGGKNNEEEQIFSVIFHTTLERSTQEKY